MFSQQPFSRGVKGHASADTGYLRSLDGSYEGASMPDPGWCNNPDIARTAVPGVAEKSPRSPTFNVLDLTAVLISSVALALSIATISPSLPYAARLQYPEQIIVIGFLLGIMNQALNRVLPWFCLVLERQIGSSSLQNFDGLLRWSPFSSYLHFAWRVLIILTLALPLALSVLYKRYTGGVGHTTLDSIDAYFSPVALPGLHKDVPGLSIMSNATVQFLVDAKKGTAWVGDERPKPFGYNLISISNTSAAALDIPVPDTLSHLQKQLGFGESYYLNTSARGTVATYSAEFDNNRNDNAKWNNYKGDGSFQEVNNYDGSYFGMLNIPIAVNDDLYAYDASWIFLGDFVPSTDSNSTIDLENFRKTAQLFHVRRHNCKAALKISRSSIQLLSGECSSEILPYQYQYYNNSELALAQSFLPMLQQALGPPFDESEPSIDRARRLIPTYAVVVASLYQCRCAMSGGIIPVQWNGPVYSYWIEQIPDPQNPSIATNSNSLNETYLVKGNLLSKTSPTLRPDATLYLVLAAQPMLIVIAFLGPLIMAAFAQRRDGNSDRRVILPRNFTLVEVLAGVDRDSLRVFTEPSPEEVEHETAARKARKQVTLDLQSSDYQPLQPDFGTSSGRGLYRWKSHDYQPRQRSLRSIRYVLKPRINKRRAPQHAIHLLPRTQASPPYNRASPSYPIGSRSPSPSERPILTRNASSIGGLTTTTIDGTESQHEIQR